MAMMSDPVGPRDQSEPTTRETHERALPQYVERELREYLKRGILAHGFLRARCRSCGKDLLVALSCKKRGVWPSCNAGRMFGTAAHLTDHVVPEVPLRQWVLAVPFERRLLLARDPRALTAWAHIRARDLPLAARACPAVRASFNSKRSGVLSATIRRQHELERSFPRCDTRRRLHRDQGRRARQLLAPGNTKPSGR
jgi:hypothetical protein